VTFNGIWYKADYREIDYYPTTSSVTSRQYNVYLPDTERYSQPVNGWPVHIVTRCTNWITTDDIDAGTGDQIVGGPSPELSQPPKYLTTLILEPQFYALLDREVMVVVVDVTAPWSASDTTTSGDGDGIVHPPGKVTVANGGPDPADTDGWSDDDRPNCFKEFVWAIQNVLFNASTYGIDPTRWTLGASAGAQLGDAGGVAGATMAAWIAASPDFADPSKTDFRQQSTAGCKGVYCGQAALHLPMFALTGGSGNMGEAVDGGYGDFMFLANATTPATFLADEFGDAELEDMYDMSVFHVLGKDAAARARNSSGTAFYLYQSSASATSLGTDTASDDVILDGDEGADTSTTTVYPKLVKDGTSTETTLDPAAGTSAARTLNRKSPLMGYALMRRLRQIETALFHTSYSRLVVDDNTRAAAAALLSSDYTGLEYATTLEPGNVTDRITAEVDWLVARLALPPVVIKPGLSVTECMGHINHVLGGQPASQISPMRLINEAGRRLVAAHGWRYLQGRSATLDLVNGQSYVDLPDDFIREIAVYMTDSLTKTVTIGSMDEILQLRTTTIVVGALDFWVAIVQEQQDPGGGAPVPRMEIWPTPDADSEGAMTLYYRSGWAEMRLDSDYINVPRFIEPLYIEILRAVAEGYERPGKVGHISEIVGRVLAGPTMKGCVRQDSQIQATRGVLRGGAVQDMADIHPGLGAWGYLVQAPS